MCSGETRPKNLHGERNMRRMKARNTYGKFNRRAHKTARLNLNIVRRGGTRL